MMKGARLVLRLSLIIGTIGWVLPAAAKSGAALYMERCAGCHDHATAHVPPLSAIKAMTQSAIHSSLTAGKMQTQTVGLSANELESIIAYIAPTGRSQARRNLASSCSLSKKRLERLEPESHERPVCGGRNDTDKRRYDATPEAQVGVQSRRCNPGSRPTDGGPRTGFCHHLRR